MTDAIAIIGDLVKRVHRLERRQLQQRTASSGRASSRPAPTMTTDPETDAIRRYLTSGPTRESEDREIRALRNYLTTPSKGQAAS